MKNTVCLFRLNDRRNAKKTACKEWSVLGHSYGGSLATLYAYTYPDCVNKIILDCPSLNFIDSSKSVAYYLTDYMNKSHNSEAIELCEKIKKAEYKDKQVIFDILTLLDYVRIINSEIIFTT